MLCHLIHVLTAGAEYYVLAMYFSFHAHMLFKDFVRSVRFFQRTAQLFEQLHILSGTASTLHCLYALL